MSTDGHRCCAESEMLDKLTRGRGGKINAEALIALREQYGWT